MNERFGGGMGIWVDKRMCEWMIGYEDGFANVQEERRTCRRMSGYVG
jgi:hypothetical protein